MKQLAAVAGMSVFSSLWMPGSIAGNTGDSCLVLNNKVGPVQLGMSVDEMYKVCRRQDAKLVDLQLEGLFSPALVTRCDGHNVTAELTITKNVWTVFRIRVTDPCFHTREGIGVQSTFAALKRAYPNAIVSAGEGREFAVVNGTLSFEIGGPADTYPQPNDKVIAMLVSPM